MIHANQCVHCLKKLHNAVFCPRCGKCLCSWTCYQKHSARHQEVLHTAEPLKSLQAVGERGVPTS